MKIINKNNYFNYTYVDFQSVQKPERKPDFISESGSEYWYTEKGVYRYSDHWNEVGTCIWKINNGFKEYSTGFASWEDFLATTPIEDLENGWYTFFNKRSLFLNITDNGINCYDSKQQVSYPKSISIFSNLKKINPVKCYHLIYENGIILENKHGSLVVLFDEDIMQIESHDIDFKLLSLKPYTLEDGGFEKISFEAN